MTLGKLYEIYEHKITKFRVAFIAESLTPHKRAMSRRRRRINEAIRLFDFSTFITCTYDDRKIEGDVFAFHSSKDIRCCLNRIKVYFRKMRIPKFSYVWVCEYGSLRGRPHWHVLSTIDYHNSIIHKNLAKWWGYGFVKIKPIQEKQQAKNYLNKYMVKGDIQKTMRRYGTSQDIPKTPKSEWTRLQYAYEEELLALVQEWNTDIQYEPLLGSLVIKGG